MAEADRRSQPGKPTFLRRAARKAARIVYRMALPVLRPLAFRTQRYLLQGIQDELGRMRVDLVQEIRHAHAVGLEVLQKTAETVQHQVLVNAHHWHTVASKDAQALSAGLHQGIQASRESIRDEMLRLHEAAASDLRVAMNEAYEVLRAVAGDYASDAFSRLDRIELLGSASARRVAVHSNQDTILIKTEVGYVLCADSDHAVVAGLLDTGELERGTRLLMERFLRRGDVFVDVGAHLGLLSLAAARAMQGQGKIFAFEPFPQTRAMLERSIWINGFSGLIEVHGAAVSNRIGETQLFVGATSGHHSIFPLNIPSPVVQVPLTTLDSRLPDGQTVDLLKIDAEGAELNIIEGARSLLANNPDISIIVEFGPAHLKRVGHSLDQWFAAFAEFGFIYRGINPDSGMLEKLSQEQLALAESINLFFARTESNAWKKLGTVV